MKALEPQRFYFWLQWNRVLCNNHQEEGLNWALHRALLRCAPANKGTLALTPLPVIKKIITNPSTYIYTNSPVVDSDRQIRRGRSSRPWDGGGGVDGLQNFFSAQRASFWSKNKGGGPLGSLPWIRQCSLVFFCNSARRSQIVRLRIVPWVFLWITGLQLRVICVPTFDLCRGTQWLFSVKYLFGEAKIT